MKKKIRTTVTVVWPRDLAAAVRQAAAADRRTVASEIRELLAEALAARAEKRSADHG